MRAQSKKIKPFLFILIIINAYLIFNLRYSRYGIIEHNSNQEKLSKLQHIYEANKKEILKKESFLNAVKNEAIENNEEVELFIKHFTTFIKKGEKVIIIN